MVPLTSMQGERHSKELCWTFWIEESPNLQDSNIYILVISDYFTKWTDTYLLRRHTAENVAEALITRFIVQHGAPKHIHSNQSTEFESKLIHALSTLLGVKKDSNIIVPYPALL